MDLDRLQVTLRQRSVSETLDLGLRIHQQWSGPVYRAWFATVFPAWVLILCVSGTFNLLEAGVLCIWWLKPLWDRVPLFVISRAIFGATPTVREVLRHLPTLWTRQLFVDLIWYRLSPSRSLLMPITQLEGLTGTAARQRRHVLGQGSELGGAITLLFAGTFLEVTLSIGMLSFGLMMMPDLPGYTVDTIVDAMLMSSGPMWLQLLPHIGWLAAVSLVEPVYVSAGFALYIHRRTNLEGWDIELSFRRLAARFATRSRIVGMCILIALLGGSPSASLAGPATADHSISVQPDNIISLNPMSDLAAEADLQRDLRPGPSEDETRKVAQAADAVFARSEFGYDKEITTWTRKSAPTFAGMDFTPLVDWMERVMSLEMTSWLTEWFSGLLSGDEAAEPEPEGEAGWFEAGLSSIVEILLWSVVAALAISGLLLLYNKRKAMSLTWDTKPSAPQPSIQTIGDIRGPRTIVAPEHTIPAQVWNTWTAGDPDTALAMLYNAALAQLASSGDLELDQAWTEGDCSRAVRAQVGGAPARYFQRVVRARTRISYAHQRPNDDEVRALCNDWSQLGGEA